MEIGAKASDLTSHDLQWMARLGLISVNPNPRFNAENAANNIYELTDMGKDLVKNLTP